MIVAVASRSEERANEFAGKQGISRSYGSYTKLSDDPDIDVVYIGTWHTSHVPLSKMMLNAGKHVLCEKPMCLNVEQVHEVFKLARDKKRFFMEPIWSRAFPIYKHIRDEILSGRLEVIRLVTATLAFPSVKYFAEMFDGMLVLTGIYPIQFACWVFQNEKPEKVTAMSTVGESGYDEEGCIILSYKNGAKASLSYNGYCNGIGANSAVIHGTKGMIQIQDGFWCPVEAAFPNGKLSFPLNPADSSVYNYPNSMGLRYEAECVRKCIIEGVLECPQMTYEDSLAIHSIMDEIIQQIGVQYNPKDWTDESNLV